MIGERRLFAGRLTLTLAVLLLGCVVPSTAHAGGVNLSCTATQERFGYTEVISTDNQGGHSLAIMVDWLVPTTQKVSLTSYPDMVAVQHLVTAFVGDFARVHGDQYWEVMTRSLVERILEEPLIDSVRVSIDVPSGNGLPDRSVSSLMTRQNGCPLAL